LERGHVEGAEEEESIAAIFASSVEANRNIAKHWNRESTTRSLEYKYCGTIRPATTGIGYLPDEHEQL